MNKIPVTIELLVEKSMIKIHLIICQFINKTRLLATKKHHNKTAYNQPKQYNFECFQIL